MLWLSKPQTALDGILLIFVSDSEQWHFQAGDDTPFGWLVTGIYAVLCILCWWEALRPKTKEGKSGSLPNSYRRLTQADFAVMSGLVVTVSGLALWNSWKHSPPLERLVFFGFYGTMATVLCIVSWREVFRSGNPGRESRALSRTAWIWRKGETSGWAGVSCSRRPGFPCRISAVMFENSGISSVGCYFFVSCYFFVRRSG